MRAIDPSAPHYGGSHERRPPARRLRLVPLRHSRRRPHGAAFPRHLSRLREAPRRVGGRVTFELVITSASGAVALVLFPTRLARALTVIQLAAAPVALRLVDPQA